MGSPELVVAIVAMVVSAFALVIAVAQALQQYVATADGFRRCQPSVIDGWAKYTQRLFRWRSWEFRFETRFAVPEIVIYDPMRRAGGPAKRTGRIVAIDGQSWEDIMISRPEPEDHHISRHESIRIGEKQEERLPEETTRATGFIRRWSIMRKRQRSDISTHTLPSQNDWEPDSDEEDLDDEFATWVSLLRTMQEYEFVYRYRGRSGEEEPLLDGRACRLRWAPGVRVLRKTWDFMPPDIVKPYAVSNLGDIVALAHHLGLQWKVFDPRAGDMQADSCVEGRDYGLSITSTWIRGLGAMIFFSATKRISKDRPGRLFIPSRLAASMGFGFLPRCSIESGCQEDSTGWRIGSNDSFPHLLSRYSNEDVVDSFHYRPDELSNCISVFSEIPALICPVLRLRGSRITRIMRPSERIVGDRISRLCIGRFFYHLWRLQKLSPTVTQHPQFSEILGDVRRILDTLGISGLADGWLAIAPAPVKREWSVETKINPDADVFVFLTTVAFQPNLNRTQIKSDREREELERFRRNMLYTWRNELMHYSDFVAANRVQMKKLDTIHDAWDSTSRFLDDENTMFGLLWRSLGSETESLYKLCLNAYISNMIKHAADFKKQADLPTIVGITTTICDRWQATLESLDVHFNLCRLELVDQFMEWRKDLPEAECRSWATAVWVTILFRSICWHLLHSFSKSVITVGSDWWESKMPVYIG